MTSPLLHLASTVWSEHLHLVLILFLALPLIGACSYVTYNLFAHPLRKYPGPKLWASCDLPWTCSQISGNVDTRTLKLHDKYGSVVRIRPNALSYSTPTAWKTIYGHRSVEMPKDLGIFPDPPNGVHGILTSDRATHSRQRKVMAHAFSEKALREQEPMIQAHISKLIERIGSNAQKPFDIVKLLNFATFDIIGDLSFGRSFGCLDGGDYHPFVADIHNSSKAVPTQLACRAYGLGRFRRWVTPKELVDARKLNHARATATVNERIAMGESDRKDFMTYMLAENTEKGMTTEELNTTALTMISAGSETTATLLSGAVNNLLSHPECYGLLTREIRKAFQQEDEITFTSVNQLPYLIAVLQETLRIYPPLPTAIPRIVPRGGEIIDDMFVPAGVSVAVHQIAANNTKANFHEPDAFLPERWLPETKDKAPFATDLKSAMQPFSTGPRVCIGKNLAYAEMRVILARLLWRFDLKIEEESRGWEKQKTYIFWSKPELMVSLTPVQR